jgi:hypothetical protein
MEKEVTGFNKEQTKLLDHFFENRDAKITVKYIEDIFGIRNANHLIALQENGFLNFDIPNLSFGDDTIISIGPRAIDYFDDIAEEKQIEKENKERQKKEDLKRDKEIEILELQSKSIEASIKIGEDSVKLNAKTVSVSRVTVFVLAFQCVLLLMQVILMYKQWTESNTQSKLQEQTIQHGLDLEKQAKLPPENP